MPLTVSSSAAAHPRNGTSRIVAYLADRQHQAEETRKGIGTRPRPNSCQTTRLILGFRKRKFGGGVTGISEAFVHHLGQIFVLMSATILTSASSDEYIHSAPMANSGGRWGHIALLDLGLMLVGRQNPIAWIPHRLPEKMTRVECSSSIDLVGCLGCPGLRGATRLPPV